MLSIFSLSDIFPFVSLNFAGGASMVLRPEEYLLKMGVVVSHHFSLYLELYIFEKFFVIILNFRLFHVVDKLFLVHELNLPTFPRGRQKSIFFVNFMLFLPNVRTLFLKNTCPN